MNQSTGSSTSWGTIAIEGIEIFGYHGVYPIEKKVGHRFVVDVYLRVPVGEAGSSDDLADTVDYSKVYQMVLAIMNEPVHLLEKLVKQIQTQLLADFPRVAGGRIRVAKRKPLAMEQCIQTYLEVTFERIPSP
jgi:dihydroneopterin aldolase